MAITLYDLAGADPARRFSPYCWRTRMALAHKGLAVETVPWRFTDREALTFSGQGKVPVIVDGGKTVFDSWTIADYLDQTYADRPPLLATPAEWALAKFVGAWADTVVHPGVARLAMADVWAHLTDEDKVYFRKSREERFGTTLEAFCAGREEKLAAFRQSLAPLRTTLQGQDYLGGAAPNYADYVVFGAFQWARCTSPIQLLAADDPVAAWRRRLLDAFDGLAGKAVGYAA
jgi:glutathione S-transferase